MARVSRPEKTFTPGERQNSLLNLRDIRTVLARRDLTP
jgi:hypothetical protein